MTIKITEGDLLQQSDVDAIVNTVNCVGVMGKGIALQFKKKWPTNFKEYASACKRKEVRPGKMHVYHAGALATPKYVINFPTKDHWRGKSKVEFITEGLKDLLAVIKELDIQSIAIPPLGCGNGGLDWNLVKTLIEDAFVDLPELDVRLFPPLGAPEAKNMEVKTPRPNMTPGRAAILKVIETYRSLNYGLSKIEVQKLAYFLQITGQDLKLKFEKNSYGPYADVLRHALDRIDGHFIRSVGDGVVESEIEPIPAALEEADQYTQITNNKDLLRHVASVEDLIQGFQSPYGMELLATVHWVFKEENAKTPEEATRLIQNWNRRKKEIMKPEHIKVAWDQLGDHGWLN
jgi:O-acetyl-ADP-ribose deacetylase (regulator of RNase III)